MVGIYYKCLSQKGEIDETFFKQVMETSKSQDLFAGGTIGISAGRETKQYISGPANTWGVSGDTFLIQMVEKPTRREALLDFCS